MLSNHESPAIMNLDNNSVAIIKKELMEKNSTIEYLTEKLKKSTRIIVSLNSKISSLQSEKMTINDEIPK